MSCVRRRFLTNYKLYWFYNDGKAGSIPLNVLAAVRIAEIRLPVTVTLSNEFLNLNSTMIPLLVGKKHKLKEQYGASYIDNNTYKHIFQEIRYRSDLNFGDYFASLGKIGNWECIMLDGNTFVGGTKGYIEDDSHILSVEIATKYRGLGLCSKMMKFVFDKLFELNVEQVELLNVSPQAGKCYIKSSSETFDFHCSDKKKHKSDEDCTNMVFDRKLDIDPNINQYVILQQGVNNLNEHNVGYDIKTFERKTVGKYDIYWFYNNGLTSLNIPLNVAISVIDAEDNPRVTKVPVDVIYYVIPGTKNLGIVHNGDYQSEALKYSVSEKDIRNGSFIMNESKHEKHFITEYRIKWEDLLIKNHFLVLAIESESGIFAGSCSGVYNMDSNKYEVDTLYVNSDFRGNGLNDAMIMIVNDS